MNQSTNKQTLCQWIHQNVNLPNYWLAANQPSATDWFPIYPIRWPLPVHSAGRRTQWQTDRKTENADTLETKWTHGGKKQQTQEPAEYEQLFQTRSRHGNSSSLQSRAYLRAIRASEKTWQQLRPCVVQHQLFKKGACLFFVFLNT